MLAQSYLPNARAAFGVLAECRFPQMQRVKLRARYVIAMLRSTPLVILTCSLIMTSCQEPPMIWTGDAISPDRGWEATAETYQEGGPGTAACWTTVTLRRLDGTINKGKPYEVLTLDCDGGAMRAYKLDPRNASAQRNFALRWTDTKHLLVTYSGETGVQLQVVKLADVTIDLEPAI